MASATIKNFDFSLIQRSTRWIQTNNSIWKGAWEDMLIVFIFKLRVIITEKNTDREIQNYGKELVLELQSLSTCTNSVNKLFISTHKLSNYQVILFWNDGSKTLSHEWPIKPLSCLQHLIKLIITNRENKTRVEKNNEEKNHNKYFKICWKNNRKGENNKLDKILLLNLK